MRDYGKIYTNFWGSPTIQDLSDDGKLLSLYLLTSQHTNMIGCFRLPSQYVAADINWDKERVTQTLSELFQKGFVTLDERLNWVCVTQFLKFNAIENPNQTKAALKLFDQIPESCSLKSDAAKHLIDYCEYFTKENLEKHPELNKGYERVTKGLHKQFRNQEQEQEQEQELKTSCPIPEKNQESGHEDQPINGKLLIPVKKIVDSYKTKCPELVHPRMIPKAVEATIKQRFIWVMKDKGFVKEEDAVQWFDNFFCLVNNNDFLCGRKPPTGNREKPFKASLEWLVKETNFNKVISGNYKNDQRKS